MREIATDMARKKGIGGLYIPILLTTLGILIPISSGQSLDEMLQEAYELGGDAGGKLQRGKTLSYPVEGTQSRYVTVQFDMIMQKRQWTEMLKWNDESRNGTLHRQKRKGTKIYSSLWTDATIPFEIRKSDFFDNETVLIYEAMDVWQTYTCVTFKNNDDLPRASRARISFEYGDDGGCSSFVGRKFRNRAQSINLGAACRKKPIIIHEIGHALGLYHEHMRPDRENHVSIHFDNIVDGGETNFLIDPFVDTGTVPYDYTSIMHYGKLFLSRNKTASLYTIEPTDESYLDIIGHAQGASFSDIKMVNHMYGCADRCAANISCPTDGFLGRNCLCYCPGNSEREPVVECRDRYKCNPPVEDETFEYLYDTWEPIYPTDARISEGQKIIMRCSGADSADYGQMEELTCQQGAWLGDRPTCPRRPCQIEAILDEDYVVTLKDQQDALVAEDIPSNTTLLVRCRNAGLSELVEILCIDGDLFGSPPSCQQQVGCLVPPIDRSSFVVWTPGLINQVFHGGEPFAIGQELVILCSNNNNLVARCMASGVWDKWGEDCLPSEVKCKPPTDERDKFVYLFMDTLMPIGLYDVPFSEGEMVAMVCSEPALNVEYTKVIECRSGEWIGDRPPCPPVIPDRPDELNCRLTNFSDRGIQWMDSSTFSIIEYGEVIRHGDNVTATCEMVDYDEYMHTSENIEEATATNVTCDNGELKGPLPSACTTDNSISCSTVRNARIDRIYGNVVKVTCLMGYSIPSSIYRFTCNYGEWEPFSPLCEPDKCRLPRYYNGTVINERGNTMFGMITLNSGDTIQYHCPAGTFPARTNITCLYGRLNTDTGQLPGCNHVVCPPPRVVNVAYYPRKMQYNSGETVYVGNCRSEVNFVGSPELRCNMDGTWSGQARCADSLLSLCDGNPLDEQIYDHSRIVGSLEETRLFRMTLRECAQECLTYRRFICTAVSFGRAGSHDKSNTCILHGLQPGSTFGRISKVRWWQAVTFSCQ